MAPDEPASRSLIRLRPMFRMALHTDLAGFAPAPRRRRAQRPHHLRRRLSAMARASLTQLAECGKLSPTGATRWSIAPPTWWSPPWASWAFPGRGGNAETGFDCSSFVRAIYQLDSSRHAAAPHQTSRPLPTKRSTKGTAARRPSANTMRRAFNHIGNLCGRRQRASIRQQRLQKRDVEDVPVPIGSAALMALARHTAGRRCHGNPGHTPISVFSASAPGPDHGHCGGAADRPARFLLTGALRVAQHFPGPCHSAW